MTMSGSQPLSIALMLESDGPGGAEIVVFQIAEELRRRGHRVHPVGPEDGVGWLGKKFVNAGFEPEVFHLRRALDWGCVQGLVALFDRLDVDVVHSHEFTMAVYGAAAARLARARHVITMHGNRTMTHVLRRRVALRWAFRASHATIAVSQATKRQLDVDLGLPRDRIGVIPNGIPKRIGNAEAVRCELGVQDGEVVLLAVGNLDPRKGHRVLLKALASLRARGLSIPWRLVIAGGRGGPERRHLEAFAREQGMADRLHILSHRDDVHDLQALADIFVMPSLWEGLPLALLEAMLAGNAIVASATSGIPEAITTGEEGLLVPPGDADGLADALGDLLTDPGRRAELGDRAYTRATSEFTIGVMADRYEKLYLGGSVYR